MSPSHLINDNATRPRINGPRPSTLKINKDSHLIQKSSSSSTNSSSSLSIPPNKQQQRQPIIIYTHSPKIIRTEAHNFMALVQKLTGMTQSVGLAKTAKRDDHAMDGNRGAGINGGYNDSSLSPPIPPSFQFVEENGGIVGDVQMNPFVYDHGPLFTPAMHYRCPSVMEVLKPFPKF